jgi:hypothetical protein
VASSSTSSERRRSPRYVVHGVRGYLTFQAEARIVDLSLAGVSVETAHHLQVGKGYSIKLAHDGRELRIAGTVLRSRLGTVRREGAESEPVYRVGIRFTDPTEQEVAALRGLLGASAEVSLEGEVVGRFELGVPESVRLHRDYRFDVLKISATGMLIEANLAPRKDSLVEVCVPLAGEELRATARIAYVAPVAGAPDRHELGIELRDLTPSDRARLESFIVSQVT